MIYCGNIVVTSYIVFGHGISFSHIMYVVYFLRTLDGLKLAGFEMVFSNPRRSERQPVPDTKIQELLGMWWMESSSSLRPLL